MAKRITEVHYTNPDVKFERQDVEERSVIWFALTLGSSLLVVVLTMLWYGRVLLEEYRKPDLLEMPAASVDVDRLPPEPRLEAIDDVREGKVRPYPPRAKEYLHPLEEKLRRGDPAKKMVPIAEGMKMAGRLPVRTKGDTKPPVNYEVRLPSKASSGRTETGGQ